MSSKYDDDDDFDDGKMQDYDPSRRKGESKGDDDDAALTDDDLINKVQRYFYEDDSFSNTCEQFVNKRCNVIDLDNEEYQLEYTTVYNEFRELFEELMEGYIKSLGATVVGFYRALKSKIEEDENSGFAIFGQILSSVTDFDIFMQMMREAAYKKAHK
mmetsp:Transcript_28418/g.28725  ORF Transcript_28418/g.28725 Transcript_28418/m.28725 type:complete len:158 (-) Transcript_28418:211-684(-)|eukprot:CAMPEP_0182427980 /NCGR_PEP_ID=MMETSP1167-20130531/20931_1 /TAXON_ID=2988 /ORGANISM="Mallomonas Sp, Strain CCMP3275" /LENGTH=157 /DNA_ID=CAMNT_0024610591 /DNA_START=41 /DNA_END=514 /DNA_ORIENTATION=+